MIEGKEFVEKINQYIYFKEYANYELVIERKYKTTIELYHENPNIRNKVTLTSRDGNILSGIINFRGDIDATMNNIDIYNLRLNLVERKINNKIVV